jgi:hypothetical protein
VIDTIGADLRAGKRVLLGHGTTPFIWNGKTDVLRFRSNTLLELIVARQTPVLASITKGVQQASYDRVYLWRGDFAAATLPRSYRVVGTIEHAGPEPLPVDLRMGWGQW